MDTDGKYYTLQYKDKETGTMLYLQGAFPTNNSQIIYHQAYPRVGNCFMRKHKDTHIIPLVGSTFVKRDPKCL